MNSARRWDKRSAIWYPHYSSVIGGDPGIWGGTAAYKYGVGIVHQYAFGTEAPSSMSVPNLKGIAQFFQKLLRGSRNSEIRSRDPGHAHLWVVLWSIRREAPSSMSVPKLKWMALFVQKLSQHFEIGSLDPGHAHLGVVLYSIRRRSPSSISVSNLKRIESIRSKIIKGVPKLGHFTPATPTNGSFYGPYARMLRPLCLY